MLYLTPADEVMFWFLVLDGTFICMVTGLAADAGPTGLSIAMLAISDAIIIREKAFPFM
jgi:hypothetical protein